MKNKIVNSGIEGFDALVGGGLPASRLYLLEGPSGSGKTTFALQFLLEGLRNGETSLFIGTSETEEEINSIAESHGWSLEGLQVYYHESVDEDDTSDQTVLFPAELELPKTIEALLSVVEKIRPDRLVIDSLTDIRLLAREEYIFWNQVRVLKQYFRKSDCTVLFTDIPISNTVSVIHCIIHGKISLTQKPQGYGPDRRHIRITKMQNTGYRSGFHDYKIVTGGLICFPRLIAAESRTSFNPVLLSTGNDAIDEILGGGLDLGSSILFNGPSGTGKSLVASMCACAAAERGEKVGMYIFDERIHTLTERSKGIGLDLEEHMQKGLLGITQQDPPETTPGEFSYRIKKEVENGASMIIIDSLNGYLYAMPEEKYLTLHLHELSSYLSQQKVVTIFISTNKTIANIGEISAFDISYLADTVVNQSFFVHEGHKKKSLTVYKRRIGKHDERTWMLEITERGIELGGPIQDL